jgi:hypothetical protein
MDVLAGLGASTQVADDDRAVASVAVGGPAELPAELDPDQQEVLVLAALQHGHVDNVAAHVGLDRLLVVGGGPPGTLLHHACWVGDAGVVERLLQLGADPARKSGSLFDTPLAWAVLDSPSWRVPGRDFVRVAALLLAAGAELEPRFAEVAEGPLAAYLESRA